MRLCRRGRSRAGRGAIAENLHRCDLTKEQRDQHIRRYAELLEARREVSRQYDAKPASGPKGGRPQGLASQVAEETGLSVDDALLVHRG